MSQITTTLDNIQLKLSNLEKVLWPEDGITKAELIQYYLSVYEYMKPHIMARPLTLIRFPEGIYGNKFYSKNAPDFTPSWVPQVMFSDIKYVNIQKSADLIYVANLASLELHAMTIQMPHSKADTMIFDLDPSDGFDFEALKEICNELYQHIISLGYHPHIKTSGSKGLHIYVPISPQYTREEVFETTKIIGQEFVDKNKNTTLKISKESRQGKILIDIYRNHQSQTCIAPFSTRAKVGAPVSMPILYEHLSALKGSNEYNIRNAVGYLQEHNPWSNYFDLQSPIHNKGGSTISTTYINESLKVYEEKRDFEKTNEPTAVSPDGYIPSNRYTIQMHDATNLHYDLRLEENGVLTSWAIPKSLPTRQGIKRLAIRTEDHPLKYLDFEGIIPQGEYGGGTMWIFDKGQYDIIKKEEKSYTIKLKNGDIQGTFSLFHTKENQWIIELKNEDKPLILPGFMLAEQMQKVPLLDFIYEIKWDGIRIFATKEGNSVNIWSKSGKDLTPQFPEIERSLHGIDAETAILDGEIVCLDKQGIPVFSNVISRMHTKSKSMCDAASKSNPATLYLFDLPYLDGKSCINLPIERRKEWVKLITPISENLRISDVFEDGEALFNGIKGMGMEGIMGKRKGSKYLGNKRSPDWVKIKVRTIIDVQIIGYTKGNGDRADVLGALHVGVLEGSTLKYMGKVGTGFDEIKLKEIFNLLNELPKVTKVILDKVEEEYNSIWIENGPICEVQYASLTPNGTMREPVFFRLKIEE